MIRDLLEASCNIPKDSPKQPSQAARRAANQFRCEQLVFQGKRVRATSETTAKRRPQTIASTTASKTSSPRPTGTAITPGTTMGEWKKGVTATTAANLIANSAGALHQQLHAVSAAATWSGLALKPQKCARLHLNHLNGRRKSLPSNFQIQGQPMRILQEGQSYKYLVAPQGWHIDSRPTESIAKDGSMEILWKKNPPEDRREQPRPVAKDRRHEDILTTPTGLPHEGIRLSQGRPSRLRQRSNHRVPQIVVATTEVQQRGATNGTAPGRRRSHPSLKHEGRPHHRPRI
ncbi:hypothetical protein J437_LFUL004166 [Ladona fulva]|uniref:Uncharacterized protein n=1 Tax=Ladona fulva TaxID=123851 RepID=A0A8K0K410_LADFU|nr:hypothetical protein J437_LFUL004166 [Ladona fulva]